MIGEKRAEWGHTLFEPPLLLPLAVYLPVGVPVSFKGIVLNIELDVWDHRSTAHAA